MNLFCNLSVYTSKIFNSYQHLSCGRLLFSYLKEFVYLHQLDFDERPHHAYWYTFLPLSDFLQFIGINAEILLQFVIQDAEIII